MNTQWDNNLHQGLMMTSLGRMTGTDRILETPSSDIVETCIQTLTNSKSNKVSAKSYQYRGVEPIMKGAEIKTILNIHSLYIYYKFSALWALFFYLLL